MNYNEIIRRRFRTTRIFCWAALFLFLIGCVPQSGGLRPTSRQFSSDWVSISMGGMMQVPGENEMALNLVLKNKTDKPIWVKVTFNAPAPGEICSDTEKIDPAKTYSFNCPQKTLVANTDYPIEVITYLDGPGSNQVERTFTKFFFSKRDVKGFDAITKMLRERKSSN